ncbi:uncharacterized protein LOC105180891 isoform X4 [Harpegnathos saltator]|uniref:uncharacterized protein LOC105180891 isoform X4 n=1 Tax=Harpegnathos saltator TaxID=610380 RepID=UPI000DBEDF10|nr:uncharacterized protein LOC105180891 isoform X4 [Harpegnathos saltator]
MYVLFKRRNRPSLNSKKKVALENEPGIRQSVTNSDYCSSKYPRELIDHAVHDRCCKRRRSLKRSSPSLSKLWKTICVYLVGSPIGIVFGQNLQQQQY